MAKLVDITGREFDRLTVLRRAPGTASRDRFHNARWECRCKCGKICVVAGASLRRGDTRSCGCLQDETRRTAFRQHGMTGTPEHGVWLRIIQCCTNPKSSSYHNYGGRGIKVCKRWRDSFAAFFSDMGKKPANNYSIERNDNDKDYAPENCRWATVGEQARNRRDTFLIAYKGERLCLLDWAIRLKVGRATIYNRIQKGLSPTEAIKSIAEQAAPLIGGPRIGSGLVISVDGKSLTVQQWCEILGRTKAALYSRIRKGQTPESVVASIIKTNKRGAILHGHR